MLHQPHGLRRMPVPVTQPPFDDELSDARPCGSLAEPSHAQGALALTFILRSGVPASPEPPDYPVPLGGDEDDLADLAGNAKSPQPDVALPDPRRWAVKVAQAAVECLHGPRPVQQLVRWTTEQVYEALVDRVSARRSPVETAGRIRTVRLCRPAARVVESTVVIDVGRRARSVALRLEAHGDRWICTALDVL